MKSRRYRIKKNLISVFFGNLDTLRAGPGLTTFLSFSASSNAVAGDQGEFVRAECPVGVPGLTKCAAPVGFFNFHSGASEIT